MAHQEPLSAATASPSAAVQALNMTLGAMMAAQAISAAAELGIADLLKDGPQSAEELARASQTHTPSLYRLLRALTTTGIFREQPLGVFALTPLGETLR